MGTYRILRKLGEGGMGVVYAAYDEELERKVAIKVLHPERGQNPVNVERFVQEMKVAAKLDGPYRDRVVKIIDQGRCDVAQPPLLQQDGATAAAEHGAAAGEECEQAEPVEVGGVAAGNGMEAAGGCGAGTGSAAPPAPAPPAPGRPRSITRAIPGNMSPRAPA